MSAFSNRANALDYLGRPQTAIEDYSLALALDPHFVNARYNRGTTYLALKDFSNAIADFNVVLKLEAGRTDALNNRGLALLERGDFNSAIDDFTSVIRLDAGLAYAYNNRGVAWRRKSDNRRAIADFSRAIDLLPGYAGALNSRGELYLATGGREAALKDFRQALAANPEHAAARRSADAILQLEVRSRDPAALANDLKRNDAVDCLSCSPNQPPPVCVVPLDRLGEETLTFVPAVESGVPLGGVCVTRPSSPH